MDALPLSYHGERGQVTRPQACAIDYDIDFLERDARDRIHVLEELLDLKRRYHISSRRMLEVGCGLGQNLRLFRHDNSVIGLDGLPAAMARLGGDGISAIQAQLDDGLCVRDSSVDWVLCLDVLEHLRHPEVLVSEIARVLRKDGKAFIGVPNHFDWLGRIRLLFGHGLDVHAYFPGSDDWNNPHLRFFTRSGFLRLLNTYGLRIVEDRSYRVSTLPYTRLLRRLGLTRLVDVIVGLRPTLIAAGFWVIVARDTR
jgi:SAM-dependent methyltransferase